MPDPFDLLDEAWTLADSPAVGAEDPADVDEPLAPEEEVALEALDAALDAQAAAATSSPAARVIKQPADHPAYREVNRPVVRAQWNPRYHRHPDWPEEWYARVPGTPLSWVPQDAAASGDPAHAGRPGPSSRHSARPANRRADGVAADGATAGRGASSGRGATRICRMAPAP
jgi:hypothetical protein